MQVNTKKGKLRDKRVNACGTNQDLVFAKGRQENTYRSKLTSTIVNAFGEGGRQRERERALV